MSDNINNELGEKLSRAFRKTGRETEAVQYPAESRTELSEYKRMDLQEYQEIVKRKTGFLNRIRMSSLISEKERDAVRQMLDSQLRMLKHKTDAAERESKAFWTAKSAEIAEIIINYTNNALNRLNKERNTDQVGILEELLFEMNDKVKSIQADTSLIPEIKSKLLDEVISLFNKTVDSVKNNDLAKRYGLIGKE